MNKKNDEPHRDEVVRYITRTHDVKKIANVIKIKYCGDCDSCDDCPIAKFFKGEVDLLGLFSLLEKCKKED